MLESLYIFLLYAINCKNIKINIFLPLRIHNKIHGSKLFYMLIFSFLSRFDMNCEKMVLVELF